MKTIKTMTKREKFYELIDSINNMYLPIPNLPENMSYKLVPYEDWDEFKIFISVIGNGAKGGVIEDIVVQRDIGKDVKILEPLKELLFDLAYYKMLGMFFQSFIDIRLCKESTK